MAFIPVKAYAKADLVANLLQQRTMPAELCSYPLTPMQMPGHSHCPISSLEPRFLQPFASTENKNPHTEISREITFQTNFVGFIMEEHVHVCAFCRKKEKSTKWQLHGWWSLIFSGMLVQDRWVVSTSSAICHTAPQLISKPKKYICEISYDSFKA